MEIEKTPLYTEILDIINEGENPASVGWTAIIHLNDNGDTYIPLQLTAINTRRDYYLAYADEISCTLLVPLGKYARQIYPNREKLQITLTKTNLKEIAAEVNANIPLETQRYSASLIDPLKALAEAQGRETNDEATLDLLGLIEISFQLYDKSLEQIRMITVGGIFRQTNVGDVIKGLLTKESARANVDNKLAVEGVDLISVSNKEKKEHIVIPQGIKLYDVANYIQSKYGVYNFGLGSYIQNKMWYVFPMYDTTRFERTKNTLKIIIIPSNKFAEIDRTSRIIGDSITILMTGETGFRDDSGTQYLKEGNGARFGDANKFLEGYNTTKDNRTIVARGKNNSEFIADTRPDKLNNVPMVGNRITANPFSVYSNLSARNGGVFKGVWENSDPTKIIPGMVTKIVYFDEEEIKEINGIVLGCMHISAKVGDINTTKHVTHSVIYVFVNKTTDEQN